MKASSNLAAVRSLSLLGLLCAALIVAGCSSTARRDKGKTPVKPVVATAEKGDAQGRFNEALAMLKNNQPQDAEQAFVALSKDFPEFAGPWTNLGILYAKSKRRDLAVAAFTRAAQLNPNNAVAFNWLGIINRELGDYNRARLAYEKSLQIAPNDPLTRLNYAILLDQYLNQPQQALDEYRRYQQLLAGKEDLRVLAWVAELEAKIKAAAPPAPPASAKTPEKKP